MGGSEMGDWQLKGAAQADYSCRSEFHAFICGDGMGLGKTLLANLAAWLVRNDPGFTLVVAPKSVCAQWKDEIEGIFELVRKIIQVCLMEALHSLQKPQLKHLQGY